jgi:tetratricopeptide (TPR) repeat protein
VLGEEHPDTLYSMYSLGVLYRRQGRYDEAEPLFISAINGARRSLSDGHRYTGLFLHQQGRCLTKMERNEEAEVVLLEAREILSAAIGAEHEETLWTIESLVELYDAWGKPEKAAEWRAKLPESEMEPEPQQAEGGSE